MKRERGGNPTRLSGMCKEEINLSKNKTKNQNEDNETDHGSALLNLFLPMSWKHTAITWSSPHLSSVFSNTLLKRMCPVPACKSALGYHASEKVYHRGPAWCSTAWEATWCGSDHGIWSQVNMTSNPCCASEQLCDFGRVPWMLCLTSCWKTTDNQQQIFNLSFVSVCGRNFLPISAFLFLWAHTSI